jgi:hypothetical protein
MRKTNRSIRNTSRRRVHRRGSVYQYNPFSVGGYELPPGAREALRLVVDNDLFWEYVEQLKVLEEKKRAIHSYMSTILKRIQKKEKMK